MFCVSGVLGEKWNVIYETESISAPKGSTVNMSCSYTYPQHTLTDTFWIMCEKDEKNRRYEKFKRISRV